MTPHQDGPQPPLSPSQGLCCDSCHMPAPRLSEIIWRYRRQLICDACALSPKPLPPKRLVGLDLGPFDPESYRP